MCTPKPQHAGLTPQSYHRSELDRLRSLAGEGEILPPPNLSDRYLDGTPRQSLHTTGVGPPDVTSWDFMDKATRASLNEPPDIPF